jgi:transcriptional regulator with XRE-family HTH domain
MALFFDSAWFDAQLARAGLSRADVAAALGLSDREIGELWKDQREVHARDVRMLAALLGVSREEVASRAGVSTPRPDDDKPDLEARVARVEAALATLSEEIRTLRDRLK